MKKYFKILGLWLLSLVVSPIVIVIGLFILALQAHFIHTHSIWLQDKDLYYGAIVLLFCFDLISLGFLGQLFCEDDMTTHRCDICKQQMKIGEEQHTLTEDKCMCVCSKCLPTIVK